jgi:hypothetical protein
MATCLPGAAAGAFVLQAGLRGCIAGVASLFLTGAFITGRTLSDKYDSFMT